MARGNETGSSRWTGTALLAALAALILLGLAGRLLPHPANFTPVAALAVFAGFLFRGRAAAWIVPLAVMGLGDLWLGSYHFGVMAAVYGAAALPVLFGRGMSDRGDRGARGAGRGAGMFAIGASALGAAVLFYVVTNFAVWLFLGAYPMTPEGLAACYFAALPYFKYTLAGNVAWLSLLFGGHAFYRRLRAGRIALA